MLCSWERHARCSAVLIGSNMIFVRLHAVRCVRLGKLRHLSGDCEDHHEGGKKDGSQGFLSKMEKGSLRVLTALLRTVFMGLTAVEEVKIS